MPAFILAYVLLCVIAGYLGKDTRLGGWGVFYVALILTPVIAFLMVMLFGTRTTVIRIEERSPKS